MDEIALLAREIVRRGWSGPAVFLLESLRPLGGIAAAGCEAAAPLTTLLPPGSLSALFGRVVSERGGIERLLDEIERLERGG
ncbi:MAG TPA: hypothetical protein PLP29_13365 [Candidatus Ozemobacteraceae bacterium]|nr:hypothetical protein [Candidatus Ozemobacteraceae bacterium]